MYDIAAVFNEFVELANNKNVRVNYPRIHTMIFLSHGYHLALDHDQRPLVTEDLYTIGQVPVFPSLHLRFKSYGTRRITHKCQAVDSDMKLYYPVLRADTFTHSLISRVFAACAKYSNKDLMMVYREQYTQGNAYVKVSNDIIRERFLRTCKQVGLAQ